MRRSTRQKSSCRGGFGRRSNSRYRHAVSKRPKPIKRELDARWGCNCCLLGEWPDLAVLRTFEKHQKVDKPKNAIIVRVTSARAIGTRLNVMLLRPLIKTKPTATFLYCPRRRSTRIDGELSLLLRRLITIIITHSRHVTRIMVFINWVRALQRYC